MEFKDHRNKPDNPEIVPRRKPRSQSYRDYIEEQIQEAQQRGLFDNLTGAGKPLQLDDDSVYTGDKSLGYKILKDNGAAPPEIELARQIRQNLEQLHKQIDLLARRGQILREQRYTSAANPKEQEAYNRAVTEALTAYETKVCDLNRKILTLNLTTPASMHQVPLKVEQLLQEFRQMCPLIE